MKLDDHPKFEAIEEIKKGFKDTGYVCSQQIAITLYLARHLEKSILVESKTPTPLAGERIMVTGIERIHAVVGGFHLSGPYFEKIIEQTIEEFKKIGPQFLSPMHCTGWKAIQQMSQAFQEEFILNSVGSMITL